MINAIDKINQSEYLFLSSIEEFGQKNLRLIVHEGCVTGPLKSIVVGGTTINDVRSVLPRPDSTWEVIFERYIAYSVRNESYVGVNPEESWEGRLFRTYSKSKFLDYVYASTFACDEYPGPLHHYELVCTEHIIDVVVIQHPTVQPAVSQPTAG